jgi:hypothetical protein
MMGGVDGRDDDDDDDDGSDRCDDDTPYPRTNGNDVPNSVRTSRHHSLEG